MIKRLKSEGEGTILIIMILTFIVSLLMLLFIISYLDQIYELTGGNKINSGELGSYKPIIQSGNPIINSKNVLEKRFGASGTILFAALIAFLVISGTYLLRITELKIEESIKK